MGPQGFPKALLDAFGKRFQLAGLESVNEPAAGRATPGKTASLWRKPI